jgi:molybdate transport system ATP-binding protein
MSLTVEIRHRFGDFALQVAFEAHGGVTALWGASGSGKTSIVNAVAGLLRPDHARISLGGDTLVDTATGQWRPPHKRGVGYVFQDARLFPHMDVRANLLYGQRFAPRGPSGPVLEEVVEMLGIAPLMGRGVRDLSGGERQRVAIGRALLARPRLLLLDEPLAALDPARRDEILPYLERLRDSARMPILYVSHQVSEVARLATDVVALEAGSVLKSGPVAEVLSDLDLVTATGIRAAGALVRARVVAHHEDGLTELAAAGGALFLPQIDGAPGALLRVRIEAQDVMLARHRPEGLSALNILPVEIIGLRMGEGPGAMVQLRAGDDLLLARVTARSARALELAAGGQAYAVIKSVAVASGDIGAAG